MANESSEADKEGDLEDQLDRYREEFGYPAYGDLPRFKDLMLKSLHDHYPEEDFSSIRIARELGFTDGLLMVAAEEYLRPGGLAWWKRFVLFWRRPMHAVGPRRLT